MAIKTIVNKKILRLLAIGVGWFFISAFFRGHFKVSKEQTDSYKERFKRHDPRDHIDTQPFNESCNNVLLHMNQGEWIPLANPTHNSSYYDKVYHDYWMQRGITEKIWRNDGKCGNSNKLPRISGSKWPVLASWCDASSDTPCCNNTMGGHCVASSASACDCPSCVDMRKYHHAEMCEWKTYNQNCQWRNYSSPKEACEVIERSPFNDLYFVGDSLIRNMFYALLMILTGDPMSGAWSKSMSKEQKLYCQAERFFLYQCRKAIRSLDELDNPGKLCGGNKLNFTVNAMISYRDPLHNRFQKLVFNSRGNKGTIIFLHVGYHMNLNSKVVIWEYLKPALAIRDNFYVNTTKITMKWPQIYFVPPLFPGLMKPVAHLSRQGNKASAAFSNQMKEFCLKNGVTFFDVRPFSKFVHSFDGTHYGLGVNLMKNQFMLNHFESIT